MIMSPDSSSADPDPISSSCPSVQSMIQVPECTQSHGGPAIIKQHLQNLDYKNIETTNGYISPTKLHQPVYHQKPSMVPKSDEDLNLGKVGDKILGSALWGGGGG